MTAPAPTVRYVDADALTDAVSWDGATAAVEQALLDGLDPSLAADRTVVDVSAGQLLLMPAESATGVGMKLGTVAPGNPARGLPRIHGIYVLIDRSTLVPQVLMDGTALTNLRTPAVSAVAAKHLAGADARRLVVFGSGPQAWGHVQALRTVRPLESVTVVGRDPGRAERLVAAVTASRLHAEAGEPESVGEADIVVCATTAVEPLFDSDRLRPDCCVVAVGSHLPHQREVDGRLLARAAADGGVVVETRDVALREAGDVVMAIDEGAVEADQLTELASVVRRKEPRPGGLSFFKSVGMGWQDLVVAEAAFDRWRG